MPNPPYSASIIIVREHQDGFTFEVVHWDDLAENSSVPPGGSIHQILMAGQAGTPEIPSLRKIRNAATRTELKTKLGNHFDNKYPDSPV